MKTLVIIKPDATARGLFDKILIRLNETLPDISIIYLKSYSPLPRPELRKHYSEHEGKSFYEGLIWAMNRGTGFVLVLEGPNAINRLRAEIGATNPQEAKKGTIRGDFACPESIGPFNLIHASDSLASSIKEMIVWGIIKPEEPVQERVDADPDPDLALQPIKWPQQGEGNEGHYDPEQDRAGDHTSL